MVLASGRIWEGVVKERKLSPEKLQALASWAFRTYFGEANHGKPWFQEDVTEENVLDQFTKSRAPLSPNHLVEFWKALPSLQRGLKAVDADAELDAVSAYLARDKDESLIPNYNKGDATLHEMSDELGNITATMVNKIFTAGAAKLRSLTGGISPEDMQDDDLNRLMDRIDRAREEAAKVFAESLKSHEGSISAFLDSEVKAQHMTATERESVSAEEIQFLTALAEMTTEEIERALLVDIEEDDNIFKTFQNAASKKVFPRRSGRPRGTTKPSATDEDGVTDEGEEVVLPVEILAVTGDEDLESEGFQAAG